MGLFELRESTAKALRAPRKPFTTEGTENTEIFCSDQRERRGEAMQMTAA